MKARRFVVWRRAEIANLQTRVEAEQEARNAIESGQHYIVHIVEVKAVARRAAPPVRIERFR